ncbi:hypothetical protein ES703_35928 [subsurface metagenome]
MVSGIQMADLDGSTSYSPSSLCLSRVMTSFSSLIRNSVASTSTLPSSSASTLKPQITAEAKASSTSLTSSGSPLRAL